MKQNSNNQESNSGRTFDYIPEKEALKLLNISRSTLWRLRIKQQLKCYKIEGSKKTYYKISEIIGAFIDVD
jgi:hypothetical protein